jgi:endonuclease YncB( thermonuclease family)
VLRPLLAFIWLAAAPPVSDVRVVKVTDGDSLWVLTPDGAREEIRVADVDCPERDQPYSRAARRELSGLVSGKYVRLERLELDKYGRTVAYVRVADVNVSAELVRRGACWAYLEYLRDQSLVGLEKEARAAKHGLWALPKSEQVPPWEWRHRRAKRQGLTSDFTCGSKTRCAEMSSCAEARFYLERCGATKLDGDRDGVPCEAICR